MNKKFNYILLLLAATVINVIIMALLFIIPGLVLFIILGPEKMGSIIHILLPILFIVVIGGGYLIYSRLYKLFREKVNMEKYFEPLFKPRR